MATVVVAVLVLGAGCASSRELTQEFESLMEGVDGVVEIETAGGDYPFGSATAQATVVVEDDLSDDDLAAVAEHVRPFVARNVGDSFGWQFVDVTRGTVSFEVLADEDDTAAQLALARRVADDPAFAEVSLGTHEFGDETSSSSGSPRQGFGITVIPSESSDVVSAWQRARSLRDGAAHLADVDVTAWSPDVRRFITENVTGFPSVLDDPASSRVVLDAVDQARLLDAVGPADLGTGRVEALPEGIRVDLDEPTTTGYSSAAEVAEASPRASRIAGVLVAMSEASGTSIGLVSSPGELRELDGDLSAAESLVDAVAPETVSSSEISARSVEVRTTALAGVVPAVQAIGASEAVSGMDEIRVSSIGSDHRGLAFSGRPEALALLTTVAAAIVASPRAEDVTAAVTEGRVRIELGDAVTDASLVDVVGAVKTAPVGTLVTFRRDVRGAVDVAGETVGQGATSDCSTLEADDRPLCATVRSAWGP
ncbi:hypothetical protein [Frigoribacterium sp. VKM Ac-2836]|uniref:hypothetical protein n=1 Tax=Frigoribacterium sp. VKM Ac-2836 TaxID=2739014 RepID=UPI001567004C|nr:hypothetical protein [Frigoribacterium sp. VKM Ac-2836]NRD27700.1 hypothetical protein [Frigoribacterium sp. VKM Ac-2836]